MDSKSSEHNALAHEAWALILNVHARLTRQVLANTDPSADPEERVVTWQDQNATALARAATMLEEIVETEGPELAHLSVGLRLVRTLIASQA